jgi:two-component system cell cycle sensor histidine kinase/response regulator CckA
MTTTSRLAGTRVLVVDDDDEVVAICLLALGMRGGVAVGVRDADEARRRLEAEDVDVLVTDLVMPGLTGRRFLAWLEETHPHLPVVAMSGVPDQVVAASARPNVRAVLDKPFDVSTLVEAVATAAATATAR